MVSWRFQANFLVKKSSFSSSSSLKVNSLSVKASASENTTDLGKRKTVKLLLLGAVALPTANILGDFSSPEAALSPKIFPIFFKRKNFT